MIYIKIAYTVTPPDSGSATYVELINAALIRRVRKDSSGMAQLELERSPTAFIGFDHALTLNETFASFQTRMSSVAGITVRDNTDAVGSPSTD